MITITITMLTDVRISLSLSLSLSHTHTHTRVHTHTHTHTHIHTQWHIHTYAHIHYHLTHTHTHTNKHTHTNTHTHTTKPSPLKFESNLTQCWRLSVQTKEVLTMGLEDIMYNFSLLLVGNQITQKHEVKEHLRKQLFLSLSRFLRKHCTFTITCTHAYMRAHTHTCMHFQHPSPCSSPFPSTFSLCHRQISRKTHKGLEAGLKDGSPVAIDEVLFCLATS